MTRTRLTPWEYDLALGRLIDLLGQVIREHDQRTDQASHQKAARTRQRKHLDLVA